MQRFQGIYIKMPDPPQEVKVSQILEACGNDRLARREFEDRLYQAGYRCFIERDAWMPPSYIQELRERTRRPTLKMAPQAEREGSRDEIKRPPA